MHYTIRYSKPHRHFIDIIYTVEDVKGSSLEVQLPSWRPGRYELGNFAKNVRSFTVERTTGEKLAFRKITKDRWQIDTKEAQTVVVKYEYYAADLNAGSTFLDEEQLYVNPVNCLLYVPNRMSEQAVLDIEVPANYKLASPIRTGEHRMEATDVHELMDSPFIASVDLQCHEYLVSGIPFRIWFRGLGGTDASGVISDFKRFTEAQIAAFGDFPSKSYEFLIHALPNKAYHGVEHQACTVISLGPAYELFDRNGQYKELLGVSSHELYHAWNVKCIRPIEMMPYDYTRENYTRLGYVDEGVTTYMGDLMLYRADVFSTEEYLYELQRYIQRHFDNAGRLYYSVAESSYDTWIDGYVPGIPNRKVSIYTEGCMLAFICDTFIIRETGGKANLHTAMRRLYDAFGKVGKGYSEDDYWDTLAEIAGKSLQHIREAICEKPGDFTPFLEEACKTVGVEISKHANLNSIEGKWGMKADWTGERLRVQQVWPDSPADNAGLALGDEIISVRGEQLDAQHQNYLNSLPSKACSITFLRQGKLIRTEIQTGSPAYYPIYHLSMNVNLSGESTDFHEAWHGTSIKVEG